MNKLELLKIINEFTVKNPAHEAIITKVMNDCKTVAEMQIKARRIVARSEYSNEVNEIKANLVSNDFNIIAEADDSFGLTIYDKENINKVNAITITEETIDNDNLDDLKNTIIHEYAHFISGYIHSHDSFWRVNANNLLKALKRLDSEFYNSVSSIRTYA